MGNENIMELVHNLEASYLSLESWHSDARSPVWCFISHLCFPCSDHNAMTKYFFPSHPAALCVGQSRLAELHSFSCLAVIISNEHFALSKTKNDQLLSQKCL